MACASRTKLAHLCSSSPTVQIYIQTRERDSTFDDQGKEAARFEQEGVQCFESLRDECVLAFQSFTLPILICGDYSWPSWERQVDAPAANNRLRAGNRLDRAIFAVRCDVVLVPAASNSCSPVVAFIATPLVNSSSPHTYSPQQALFDQPVLSQQLLSRFVNANKPALKALKTRKAWTFGERSIKEGTGLDGLASKNVDEKTATSVLEALFDELAAQNRCVPQ